MKPNDLSKQAQQGNLIALQTCLEQALAKKQYQVNIKASLPNYTLTLRLTATAEINLSQITKLLEKELTALAIPDIKSVRIQYKSHQETFNLNPPPKVKYIPKQFGLDNEGWRSLLIGLILAIVFYNVQILTVAFSGFPLAVHEVGHAITHWLFGRPAFPTIDFAYGGGIVIVMPQSPILVVLIYLAFVGLAYLMRKHPKVLILLGIITAIYTYWLMTPINEMLGIGMGHGLEIIAIVVCFYCCLGKYFCKFGGERTIFALLGCFTTLHNARFAWLIVRDERWKALYLNGKGGLLDHDLVRLANEFFGVNYAVLANIYLVCCVIAPIVAVLLFAFDAKWKNALASLWE
jgi:hypothetical protein